MWKILLLKIWPLQNKFLNNFEEVIRKKRFSSFSTFWNFCPSTTFFLSFFWKDCLSPFPMFFFWQRAKFCFLTLSKSSYTLLRSDPIRLITSRNLQIVNRNSTHLVPLEAVNRLFVQVVLTHQFLCFAAEKQFLVKASFVAFPVFHSSVFRHLFLWRHDLLT